MTIKGYAAISVKSELTPFEYDAGPLEPLEVEVRVQYCGVCHSDLAMIDNDWGISTYPCAGTTVWSPMMHYGVRPGMKTAVLGVGGLGHLAVQFLAQFGTEVTAISSTRSKEDEARQLGATDFIATRGTNELEKAAMRFDFILSTISADVDWNAYIAALAPEGRLCIVGLPDSDLQLQVFPMINYERSVSGGRSGAPSDTAAMMEFAAKQGVKPMCEQFDMKDANRAVQHVRDGKARYRVVLAN